MSRTLKSEVTQRPQESRPRRQQPIRTAEQGIDKGFWASGTLPTERSEQVTVCIGTADISVEGVGKKLPWGGRPRQRTRFLCPCG
jgi:hypothetical protein